MAGGVFQFGGLPPFTIQKQDSKPTNKNPSYKHLDGRSDSKIAKLYSFLPLQNQLDQPSVVFKKQEKVALVSKITNIVIAKFSHGKPSLKDLNGFFLDMKLKGDFSISPYDYKHVFIACKEFEDYVRIWLLQSWCINGFRARFFKWTETFSPKVESRLAPVWIHLPGLPIYFFEEDALLYIASVFGRPLFLDPCNLDRSKVNCVSFCVEVDISVQFHDTLRIEFEGEDTDGNEIILQPIKYGAIPAFCSGCQHLGHTLEACKGEGIKGDGRRNDKREVKGDDLAWTQVKEGNQKAVDVVRNAQNSQQQEEGQFIGENGGPLKEVLGTENGESMADIRYPQRTKGMTSSGNVGIPLGNSFSGLSATEDSHPEEHGGTNKVADQKNVSTLKVLVDLNRTQTSSVVLTHEPEKSTASVHLKKIAVKGKMAQYPHDRPESAAKGPAENVLNPPIQSPNSQNKAMLNVAVPTEAPHQLGAGQFSTADRGAQLQVGELQNTPIVLVEDASSCDEGEIRPDTSLLKGFEESLKEANTSGQQEMTPCKQVDKICSQQIGDSPEASTQQQKGSNKRDDTTFCTSRTKGKTEAPQNVMHHSNQSRKEANLDTVAQVSEAGNSVLAPPNVTQKEAQSPSWCDTVEQNLPMDYSIPPFPIKCDVSLVKEVEENSEEGEMSDYSENSEEEESDQEEQSSEEDEQPPLTKAQQMEKFEKVSEKLSSTKSTRIIYKKHGFDHYIYSEEEMEDKTTMKFNLDPIMIDHFDGQQLRLSKLIESKAEMIRQRSASPVRHSPKKLKNLKTKLGALAREDKSILLLPMEEYEENHQLQIKRRNKQKQEEWATPKRRGRPPKRQQTPRTRTRETSLPKAPEPRKRGRPKKKV